MSDRGVSIETLLAWDRLARRSNPKRRRQRMRNAPKPSVEPQQRNLFDEAGEG